MQLLCLSNGHGEDAIALRILNALQQLPNPPKIEALPLVGAGHAYTNAGIPLIGSVKTMPSGGFIYMDGKQLARDIRGGLVQLTLAQWRAVKQWAAARTPPTSTPFILAVGDIVPLIFAWLSGVPYAFVGTAKSEYYIRDEAGLLKRKSWWSDRLERMTDSIYHPWERWLMSRPNCKAVFPRDSITAANLRRFGVPAFDLGNPMMDGLEWQVGSQESGVGNRESGVGSRGLGIGSQESGVGSQESGGRSQEVGDTPHPFTLHPSPPHSLTLVLLPGSRPPEAYANWETILLAMNGLIAQWERPLVFLAAIAPGLELEKLRQIVLDFRWQAIADNTYTVGLGEKQATLVLAQDRFAEFLQRADGAIAMAGTATEQFVGLGKPAILIPGKGPQFTPAFAEAYTRLLGASVILVSDPGQITNAIKSLLQNPDWLQIIAENGRRRMGEPGAANRIAHCLQHQLWRGD